MRAVTEIAAYLRKAADLYFAIYEVSCDRSAEAHGFAYAKAADTVADTPQQIMDMHILRFDSTTSSTKFAGLVPNVGRSISAVISDFVRHGDNTKIKSIEDRLRIELTPELQELAQLEGMSAPFVFGLAYRFGFTDKASLLEKLPDIRKHHDRIYMRVYRALLIDAQNEVKKAHLTGAQLAEKANMALAHFQEVRFVSNPISMGCSVGVEPACSLCEPCQHIKGLK